jgi:hypothetical protein
MSIPSPWTILLPSFLSPVGPIQLAPFEAAFALGETDAGISTVDEGGVALAAIQGLNQRDTENAALKERLDRLERLLNANTDGVK